jgi:hypothetical protein
MTCASTPWVPAFLAAVAACGGTPPAQAPPPPSATQPAPVSSAGSSAAVASATAPAPSATSESPRAGEPGPLGAVLTTDASTIQKLFDTTSRAPAATLKEKEAASGDPLASGLKEVAKKAAPGMLADGPLATGNLKEKQNVQTDVTLQPGKCYVLVGYSKKVKDLDLYLLLPPGILSGQDTTDDNAPVIGGPPQPMCPVATIPITYKLGIVADQGAGEFAVQLYSRAK